MFYGISLFEIIVEIKDYSTEDEWARVVWVSNKQDYVMLGVSPV